MQQFHIWFTDRTSVLSLGAVLFLLFFIETTHTIVGRAYYHLIGLHGNTLTNEAKSLLVLTLVVPFFVWVCTKPALGKSLGSYRAIHLGFWVWFLGASISTLAHAYDALVVLNYVCGIASALAVFYAVRRVTFANTPQVQALFSAMTLGGFIVTVRFIVGYYLKWGIPSLDLKTLFELRVHTQAWVEIALGNSGNSSIFFGLLAGPCLAIVFLKPFTRAIRYGAWITLICAAVALGLCMSRTGLIVFALSCVAVSIFVRNRKALFCSIALVVMLILVLFPGLMAQVAFISLRSAHWLERVQTAHSGAEPRKNGAPQGGTGEHIAHDLPYGHSTKDRVDSIQGVNGAQQGGTGAHILQALSDLPSDHSVSDRLDSIQTGWREFRSHALIGMGAGQSRFIIKEGNAHQLAISQGDDDGILGFLGVLIITGASIARLLKLMQTGAYDSPWLRTEFVFLLAPATYFLRGLVSDTVMNATVINAWICLPSAMLAIADALTMKSVAVASTSPVSSGSLSPVSVSDDSLNRE